MAVVKKYKARLTSIQSTIEGVYTLEFESLGSPFQYAPGQFLHLAIDTEYDGSGQWPESRCFSMQSNPSEKTIRITYAVKGAFTTAMEENLISGSEVWLKLPYGDLFQQPHNKENTVFIAGGTGITPFLSLFTHESFAGYINPKIYLGFRSEEFNIYQKELNQSSNASKILDVVYESKNGILDIHRIADKNSNHSSYFISGPPSMIKAFKQILITRGVPAKNVLTDDWE